MKLNKFVYELKNEDKYDSIYFKGGTKKYNNIKKMANIPIKMAINDEVIHELSKLKLVTVLYRGMITLDFIKECQPVGDIAFIVKDYENVGLYLDYYNVMNNVGKCENCEKLIKLTTNNKKYCESCAREILQEHKGRKAENR
jgi:hypothetical protein